MKIKTKANKRRNTYDQICTMLGQLLIFSHCLKEEVGQIMKKIIIGLLMFVLFTARNMRKIMLKNNQELAKRSGNKML